MLLFCLLLMKFNYGWVGATAREPSNPSQIPHTLTGDIRFVKNFHSRFLAQDRDIVIYLPPGYDTNPSRRYPVLYMQDGQNLFDAATSFFPGAERHFDERAQALIAERAIRPLIIVGVYSTGLYCQWDDEMIVRYVQSLPRKSDQRIWLSVGTGEADRFLSSTRSLRQALVARGWKEGSDFSYSETSGAQHNPNAWTPGVDRLLEFLFPPKASKHIL